MAGLEMLLDLLDHGCDGEPRWIALDVADRDAAAALVRVIADEAGRRGYVPIDAARFLALVPALPEEVRHRTFALLQTCRGGAAPDARSLLAAASVNARPHVLITVGIRDRVAADALVVREARALYAPSREPASGAALSPESVRYLQRVQEGWTLARSGRHTPGVRVMRQAIAALQRRREDAAVGRGALLLGRELLERARPAEAEEVFADGAERTAHVRGRDARVLRVWMAIARADAGRLSDAESMLRAARLAGPAGDPAERRWADAALARCLLWQERAADAAALLDGHDPWSAESDPLFAATALSVHTRVLLACGRLFDAGQRARAAVERAERACDPLLAVVAQTAHLRVLAAAGDLELARARMDALVAAARALHAPLRVLRARLVWAEMLRRANRSREAEQELRRCDRLCRAAPPLLRRELERLRCASSATGAPNPLPTSHAAFAVDLLRHSQGEEEDATAVRRLLERLGARLRAARTELQTASGGAPTAIVVAGGGLPPRVGGRALEAGIVIGPELVAGSTELAGPVRIGGRFLGVIACRWPLGRAAPGDAREVLELTGAVLAPRVEALLAARADTVRAEVDIPELIGASAAMAALRAAVARAAAAPFPALIEGESGVGKELVARAIHHLSARRDRRFCDVNCAALPDDLVESELFGHAKGAFTGALVERPGLFEEASGGTLFLDELPDLSARAQAKLLRVVQQGEIRRIGESFSRRVDVRVVTATNRDMTAEAAAGRFRQDLLYRLDVIRIRIPPLRERPEDVPILTRHFWRTAAERMGTRAVLSHGVLAELARYHWPGNVRELQNVVAALAVAAPARGTVRSTLLPAAITGAASVSAARLFEARRQFERRFVAVALARAGGSRTRAAAQLGVSRQGLLKLMARLGLDEEGAASESE